MIPARVHGTVPPGTIGLVKSAPCLDKRYHLQGATTLVKISQVNTIPFRLINPTTKPVTLYKGTTLGKQQKLVRTLMFNLLARKQSHKGPAINNKLQYQLTSLIPISRYTSRLRSRPFSMSSGTSLLSALASLIARTWFSMVLTQRGMHQSDYTHKELQKFKRRPQRST